MSTEIQEIAATVVKLKEFDFVNFLSLKWWVQYGLDAYEQEPGHVFLEVSCVLIILFLLLRPSYDPPEPLTRKEEDELIAEWTPEPLCPDEEVEFNEETDWKFRNLVVEGATGVKVTSLEGQEYLNFTSSNFIGLADDQSIKDACRATIEKYGVGSCGPRGFYGSIDTHLEVEKKFTEFMGTEESILYSDSIACISSVIPAFLKKGDLIIVDDGCNFFIQQGLVLSRSKVLYYKHNDMEDLKRVLESVRTQDEKRKKSKLNRRFIVTEGIFMNHGDISPLQDILALKHEYKYRILLDDSYALGVLGATGRGSCEHWNIPVQDIDIISVNMDTSLATTGGFCTGSHEVVDHQRLSGAGYCFSASSPPYTCTAGTVALGLIDEHTDRCEQVRNNALLLRELLTGISMVDVVGGADSPSPVVFLRLSSDAAGEMPLREQTRVLESICEQVFESSCIIGCPRFIPADKLQPSPSLRIAVTSMHSKQNIRTVAALLSEAFKSLM